MPSKMPPFYSRMGQVGVQSGSKYGRPRRAVACVATTRVVCSETHLSAHLPQYGTVVTAVAAASPLPV